MGNICYRPGRLDKILYVPLPPPEGRGAILQALTRKTPLAVDVDVAAVGASSHCHGFSGADLAALVREACICALKVGLPGLPALGLFCPPASTLIAFTPYTQPIYMLDVLLLVGHFASVSMSTAPSKA